ncbi:MAG: M24 family metallopeptidase [Candidatus Bipolaricaulia bacterium]
MTIPSGFSQRLAAVQRELASRSAGLLIVGLSASLRYLTGFTDEPGERLLLLLVPRDGAPGFVVPGLYAEQVKAVTGFERLFAWDDAEGPESALAAALRETARAPGAILVEDCLWSGFLLACQTALPARSFGSGTPVLAALRMRKDSHEVELLGRAGAMADEAFRRVIETPFVGRTELDVAASLVDAMRDAGAEDVAFAPLVASGPAAALPHYRAGDRRIERGDVVILDFGCRSGGYRSDVSRTVSCGAPSRDVRAAYDAVREAQQQAVDAVRPGVPAEEIDRAARDLLTARGFGEYFIHRTGHGIGLDVHEPPYIVAGNRILLEPGMAFSVEPGVYFPGRFGIRIEDVVVVSESNAVPMTTVTHELTIVK